MAEATLQIGAPDIDVDRIVAGIRSRVQERMARGEYADSSIVRVERMNLANLRDEDEFLGFFLECLRDASVIDINDFEIIERRSRFRKPLQAVKKTIWSLLKFYTYRLWSQQNLVNGLLVSAVDSVETRSRERIQQLEQRLQALEARLGSTMPADDASTPPRQQP